MAERNKKKKGNTKDIQEQQQTMRTNKKNKKVHDDEDDNEEEEVEKEKEEKEEVEVVETVRKNVKDNSKTIKTNNNQNSNQNKRNDKIDQEEDNEDVEVEDDGTKDDSKRFESSEKDSYGIEIFTTHYLGKATRKVELLSRIKILHETLKNLHDIGNKKKILIAMSGQLNSKRLIGHQDKEIRLLSAACILDILRLFAPDVPYSSEELCELFEAITIMLRGFSTYDPNSTMGSYLFYILSSLSTVRSCAILVFLSQQNIPNAANHLKDFLEALISSIRSDHSEAVIGHYGNILEVCILESEKFDQELLDTLLSPLLPSSKTENPAAYHLTQSLLSRCVTKLQPSITNFINHVLVGGIQEVSPHDSGHGHGHGHDESNLSEEIYLIIYEISKISSTYLLHILPNICIQLHAEEPEIRLEVVKLLGKLFSSPHSNYGRDFMKCFKEYLGRYVDISTPIRIEMIESGYLIFVHHSDLRELVEENLNKRLRDAEVQVRYAALSRLLELLSEDPSQLQISTIHEIAERVKDKKQEVRKIAQIGLSKVYNRHISQQIHLGDGFLQLFPEGDGEDTSAEEYSLESDVHLHHCDESCPIYDSFDTKERKDQLISSCLKISYEIWIRLEFVPGFILNCWGYPDPLDKHLVLQLIQEYILPKDKTIYKLLSTAIDPLLPVDSPSRQSSSSSGSHQRSGDVNQPSPTITRSCTKRDELKQRLDSKSPLGNYIARIYDTSAIFMFANTWTVKYLFFHLRSITKLLFHEKNIHSTSGRQREKYQNSLHREACETAELIILLAKYLPQIFEGCAQDLEEWLRAICDIQEKDSHQWNSTFRITLLTHLGTIIKYSAKFLHNSCVPLGITSEESELMIRSLSSHLISYSSHSQNPLLCQTLAEMVQYIIRAQPLDDDETNQLSQICDDFGVTGALKKLCSSQRLSSSSQLQRVSCDLHVIASLLSAYGHSARELSGISNRAQQFLSTILFNSNSSFHSKDNSENQQQESEETDYYLLALIGGIKLWLQLSIRETHRESHAKGVSGLHGTNELIDAGKDSKPSKGKGKSKDNENDDEDEDEDQYILKESQSIHDRFPSYLVDYLELLFSCLQSYGGKIRDLEISSSSRQSKIREVATICLIQMLAIKSVSKGISIQEWLTISWAFLDGNEQCRQHIFQAFSTLIQTHCIHPRFLAIPCLLASDPSLSHSATQSLLFTVGRLNKTHLELCERAMEAQEQDNLREKESYVALAKTNSPECIIPYLLYLLSHHPDFPVSIEVSAEGDEERLKSLYRSIKMMYSVILQSVGNDNNTLSILLKQVQMIFQFYSDRHLPSPPPSHSHSHSPSPPHLQLVLRVALFVLEVNIKTQIQPYSGDINLPMDLYQLKKHDLKKKFDENLTNKAIAMLTKFEGQRVKHQPQAVVSLVKKRSSPEKVNSNKSEKRKGEGKKKKTSPEKVRKRSTESTTSRPRRSVITSSSVSYADTRDSDDEAEMEEIEELLDNSQTLSSSPYSSKRGKRSLSSGSRHSRESIGSGSHASERQSLSSDEDSPSTSLPSTSGSIFAKKRKLSGGVSRHDVIKNHGHGDDEEEDEGEGEGEEEEQRVVAYKTPPSKTRQEIKKTPARQSDKGKKDLLKVAPVITTKKSSNRALGKRRNQDNDNGIDNDDGEEDSEGDKDERKVAVNSKKGKSKIQDKATSKGRNQNEKGTLKAVWARQANRKK